MSAKSFGILFVKNYQTVSDSQDQKGRLHILRIFESLVKIDKH
jgi:hypothetical protein